MIGNNKLILAIIFLPIIEIYLFIEIGAILGSFLTISLTLLTAFLGVYLLKIGTFNNVRNLQKKILEGIRPDQEIVNGISNLISAVLLILPGILTDFLGALLLSRSIQTLLISYMPNMSKNSYNYSSGGHKKTIIDVEHKKSDD
tara:strand:- start:769 stop:1200 length:432 start_codon:yes stop_codon:yes gene_type:complete